MFADWSRTHEHSATIPGTKRQRRLVALGKLAGQRHDRGWPGAGSNRRPSDFQGARVTDGACRAVPAKSHQCRSLAQCDPIACPPLPPSGASFWFVRDQSANRPPLTAVSSRPAFARAAIPSDPVATEGPALGSGTALLRLGDRAPFVNAVGILTPDRVRSDTTLAPQPINEKVAEFHCPLDFPSMIRRHESEGQKASRGIRTPATEKRPSWSAVALANSSKLMRMTTTSPGRNPSP